MPDKSFEQQVKDQLTDLQLVPDAAVWHEVEASLRKERNRRRLIRLFLLLAGCCGASFWLYYQIREQKETRWSDERRMGNTIKPSPVHEQTTTAFKKKELNKAKGTGNAGEAKEVWESKRRSELKRVEQLTPTKDIPLQTTVLSSSPQQSDSKNQVASPSKKMYIFPEARHSVIIEKNSNDKIFLGAPMDTAHAAIVLTDTSITPKVIAGGETVFKGNKKNKWQWVLVAAAGGSGVRNSLTLLSLFKSSYSNAYANAIPNSPGKAPSLRDAFSFGLALQASKQLSRKHSVGISLGYGLYQTRTSVGKRVDSSLIFGNQASSYTVNGPYFNNSNSTDYINHYHFIQADLDLQTRFRLFRVVSLRWQLGAGAAVLVASNGLHYSSSNNVSYKDRSLLTTLQTNISTGFDIGIGKQPLLYIGPQWKYFVSHLSKQPGEDQHLVQAALRVSFIFPPKKK